MVRRPRRGRRGRRRSWSACPLSARGPAARGPAGTRPRRGRARASPSSVVGVAVQVGQLDRGVREVEAQRGDLRAARARELTTDATAPSAKVTKAIETSSVSTCRAWRAGDRGDLLPTGRGWTAAGRTGGCRGPWSGRRPRSPTGRATARRSSRRRGTKGLAGGQQRPAELTGGGHRPQPAAPAPNRCWKTVAPRAPRSAGRRRRARPAPPGRASAASPPARSSRPAGTQGRAGRGRPAGCRGGSGPVGGEQRSVRLG